MGQGFIFYRLCGKIRASVYWPLERSVSFRKINSSSVEKTCHMWANQLWGQSGAMLTWDIDKFGLFKPRRAALSYLLREEGKDIQITTLHRDSSLHRVVLYFYQFWFIQMHMYCTFLQWKVNFNGSSLHATVMRTHTSVQICKYQKNLIYLSG